MAKKKQVYKVPPIVDDHPVIPQQEIHLPVSVSFKYMEAGGKHCLSHCEKRQIKGYVKALWLLTTLS